MVTRLRVAAALAAVLAAVVVICQSAPTEYSARPVELRSTFAPLAPASTTIKWPVIDFTDPKPFVPCDEIPIDVVEKLGLAFTPPETEDQLLCH